jgi:putative spermidine/putrescine transport system permease protein
VLAVPVTVLNVVASIPVALRVRLVKHQRILTTILVVPITLGTVLVAEGLLTYLGPRGWVNRILLDAGIISFPLRLLHNYWGVFLFLVITGFPFTFLLMLSYVTGVDPALENAAAVLGAGARERFRRVLLPLLIPGLTITLALSFVQAFSVFPSAILLGEPAGTTPIAAHQAAFEKYDYAMASAIAMLMAGVQIVIVLASLAVRGLVYSGRPEAGRADADRSNARGPRLGVLHLGFGGVLRAEPGGADCHGRFGLDRHPLVQDLAAGRLDAALVRHGVE